MDQEFFDELDRAITDVGTNTVWKRQIGDLLIWISPITADAQDKVNEVTMNPALGAAVVSMSKKSTLSHAIVGINTIDLTSYRNVPPMFPSTRRDGKITKVSLDKYLFNKMAGWSAHFIDDVFAVYADLTESFQKNNLKEIKFENAKHPIQELQELEARAAEIRSELGMTPLVETSKDEAKPDTSLAAPEDDIESLEEPILAFDPFAVPVNTPDPNPSVRIAAPPITGTVPRPSTTLPIGPTIGLPPQIPSNMIPAPPVPIPRISGNRLTPEMLEIPPERKIYNPMPSVAPEVIDSKLPTAPNQAPIINPRPGNLNPRFAGKR